MNPKNRFDVRTNTLDVSFEFFNDRPWKYSANMYLVL